MNSEDLTGMIMKDRTGYATYDDHDHEPRDDQGVGVFEADRRKNGQNEEQNAVEGVHVLLVVVLQQVYHWAYWALPAKLMNTKLFTMMQIEKILRLMSLEMNF